MSFGQELKDFASGFKEVSSGLENAERAKYYRNKNKDSEISAGVDRALAGDDDNKGPGDDTSTHGMLYNVGKWMGIGEKKKPAAAVSLAPVDAVGKAQALPLDGYAANNPSTDVSATTPVTPAGNSDDDSDMYDPLGDGRFNYGMGERSQGLAAGGAVIDPRDDDGKPPVPQDPPMALPVERVTVSATRPPPDDDGGAPADAGLNTGEYEQGPTAAVSPVEKHPLGPVEDDGKPPVTENPDDDGKPSVPNDPEAQQVAERAPAEPDNKSLGDALHGGMMALQQHFGINTGGQAVSDPQQVASGQKAIMSGEGRASSEDMRAVVKAVDPDGKLNHSQAVLRAMEKGYEFYMAHGEPAKANNYAAMIIQYSVYEASKHGADAVHALRAGDVHGAVRSLTAAEANLPSGTSSTNTKVNADGTVTTTEVDTKTGKKIAEHTLSGQELYQAAIGMANKTASWRAIMSAAAAAKGVNLPPSDAYNSASMKVAGYNPDGTSANTPSPASQAVPTGDQSQQGAQPPAPVTQPGNDAPLPTYMNDYAKMMATKEGGPAGAAAKNGDSVGLYQIQSKAWKDATGHDPIVNGVDERLDAAKNTAVFKQLTQQNEAIYRKATGQSPTPAILALMHQQGATGGMALLKAAQTSPNTPAVQIVGDVNKLVRNGIPANATAAQAVQKIQQYYMSGYKPGAAAPAQAQMNDMKLRPTLPEDMPAKVDIPQKPEIPKEASIGDYDTSEMSGPERVQLTKQIAAHNAAAKSRFTEQMQLYSAAVKANKPPAKGKDPLSLPVKDRGDAQAEMEKAKAALPIDPNTKKSVLENFQPSTREMIDDAAYGFYTHNDTTPHRAYQATMSMLNPRSTNFTPYEMPDGNVKVVFRTGDKMLLPRNTFDQIAAARGNEHFVMRSAGEDAGRKDRENAALADKGKKAVTAAGNMAVGAAAPAAPVLGDAVGAVNKAGAKIGRGLDKVFGGPPSKEKPTIALPVT